MSEQTPPTDSGTFRRVLSPALIADLTIALDLAILDSRSLEIAPVMARVAQTAAKEQVRPEELLLSLKSLWKEKSGSRSPEWLPADNAWLALVRTLMNAYYSPGQPVESKGAAQRS